MRGHSPSRRHPPSSFPASSLSPCCSPPSSLRSRSRALASFSARRPARESDRSLHRETRRRSSVEENSRRGNPRSSVESSHSSSPCSSPLKTSRSSLLSFSTSRRLANLTPTSSSSSSPSRDQSRRSPTDTRHKKSPPRRHSRRFYSSSSSSVSRSSSPAPAPPSPTHSRLSAHRGREERSRRQRPLLSPSSPAPRIPENVSATQVPQEGSRRPFQARLRAADLLCSPPPSPSSVTSFRTRRVSSVETGGKEKPEDTCSNSSTVTGPPAFSSHPPSSASQLSSASWRFFSSPSLRQLYERSHETTKRYTSRAEDAAKEPQDFRLPSSRLLQPPLVSSHTSLSRAERADSAAAPPASRRAGTASSLSSSAAFSALASNRHEEQHAMTGTASDEALDVRVKNLQEKAAQLKFAYHTRSKLQQQELNSLHDAVAALRLRRDLPVAGFLANSHMAERLVKDELQATQHARLTFAEQCANDMDCMLQGVRDLHRNTFEKASSHRGPEPALDEIDEALQGCREVLRALAESRKSVEASLRRHVSEAFERVKETMTQEHRICQDAQASMTKMLEDLRQQARNDIRASRENREQVEEQILQLLEDACVKVENAVLTNGNLPTSAPLA
ncbi:hypothetical protein BESB_036560 [Besnoitia besnoiti]|uniref:Uncharacterized protein n=1 Tax=Besnoitia besnoiti TaxID=94643 RepID=A0A2A9MFB3_BESBE|nr:hypothetical protein BESB_036560 [Besnoitia besnoiti]PFH37198.1 hypothetical protein BESB_036560 [Besnoitia besnoiti]